ncbi:metallophosphoesterase [Flagellimonas hymeniacidonis]|uniref:Metallophosphoesterase n=1 Tax=Flagellimonas hymeniacidonis TaxID=2603628 RepID=A0A5C8V5V7_9FLAO|nr:metallophosphoesterase [Flagellimonas hymeniacidonis]TXN37092.1 metallophosphoesterase [Flagellimonas hymeniacidonis]
MTRFLIILSIIYIISAIYGFQGFKTLFKSSWVHLVYGLMFLAALANFIIRVLNYTPGDGVRGQIANAGGIFFAFLLLGLVFGIFMLLEDIVRLFVFGYNKIAGLSETQNKFFPSRRKFISGIAMGIAALPFGALLYGMYKGKYNYKVLKYQLEFADLPDAFDGYQITQISDVHSGSFDNRKKVAYGIDLINEQKSDVILFTGDMVNDKTKEMEPWSDLFASLEAKDGKFSILGNHDYGDYTQWESEEAKAQNLVDLKNLQKEMGFDLLLDTHRYLKKDGQKIALIGVENWGRGGFKKAGDLEKAKTGIDKEDFKILMSHDPSHWEDVVINDDYHFHLTLSGHTHGMQFGVEIPGWVKWSPVKWRYKYWAGIYEELGQFINVNRGFGFIGYPGRVGIWPEISVITLKKKGLT